MMEYSVVDHTADAGIEVTADSRAELFEGAATGMFSLIVDLTEVEPAESRRIKVEGGDDTELMFLWLNELLFLLEAEGMLFSRFDVEIGEDPRLSAVVGGEVISAGRHHVMEEIKAATYHELEVSRRDGGWFARVIFDV